MAYTRTSPAAANTATATLFIYAGSVPRSRLGLNSTPFLTSSRKPAAELELAVLLGWLVVLVSSVDPEDVEEAPPAEAAEEAEEAAVEAAAVASAAVVEAAELSQVAEANVMPVGKGI